MINTLKLSLTKNLQILIEDKDIYILWFVCILLSIKFNEQCMGQSKITRNTLLLNSLLNSVHNNAINRRKSCD